MMTMAHLMEKAEPQDRQLEGEGGDDKVVANGSPTVCLYEAHQESKAHVNHHMHILEERIHLGHL